MPTWTEKAALQDRICLLAYAREGTPATWGGNGAEGADCSGFVQWVYARARIKPWYLKFPKYIDMTAEEIYVRAGVNSEAEVGGCAFYGRNGAVEHVMLVTNIDPQTGLIQVTGASGATAKVLDPVEALRAGRVVKTFHTHLYRNDFISFAPCPRLR